MIAALIGAGAIGTLVGTALAESCEVRVLVRDERTARAIVSRGGLIVDDAAPKRVVASADADILGGCDVAIVALKTYLVPGAIGALRAYAAPLLPFVSFSNGLGAVEQIEAALGRHVRVALAPTTEAVRRVETGVVRRTGIGSTAVGWAAHHDGDDAVLSALVAALASHLTVARNAPIESGVWAKLVVNAAINPVTALAGVRNGAILERRELRERAFRLAREVERVARAKAIALPFVDAASHVELVVRATAANRSSMLVDLEAGTPTEIDAINGAIVREAAALGIAVPENQAVLDEVRARLGA